MRQQLRVKAQPKMRNKMSKQADQQQAGVRISWRRLDLETRRGNSGAR
jgi:hypothetical protein